MPISDVSSSLDPMGPLGPLLQVIPTLDARLGVGRYLVIGAHARDLLTHVIAGLPVQRATHDIDISISVPTRAELDRQLAALGPRSGLVTRRTVAGLPLDVLPFGPVTRDAIFDDDGVLYDVTGMAEAFETSTLVRLQAGTVARFPTLAAMLVLTIVAWDFRRDARDAQDLGLLLEATHHGSFEDVLWQPDSLAERFDFDPQLAGPYVQGRQIAPLLDISTRDRVLHTLSGPATDLLSAYLSRDEQVRSGRRAQIRAFAQAFKEVSH